MGGGKKHEDPFLGSIAMVARERAEQVYRHGRTAEVDDRRPRFQLAQIAREIVNDAEADMGVGGTRRDSVLHAYDFDDNTWRRIQRKPIVDRLAVAAAMIMAEIDRELRNPRPAAGLEAVLGDTLPNLEQAIKQGGATFETSTVSAPRYGGKREAMRRALLAEMRRGWDSILVRRRPDRVEAGKMVDYTIDRRTVDAEAQVCAAVDDGATIYLRRGQHEIEHGEGSSASDLDRYLRSKVCFVAGRFRGDDPLDHRAVHLNVRAAEDVAHEVWRLGMTAICPHANTAHEQGALPDEAFLDGALDLMLRSDCVVCVPGWERSRGAVAEVARAREEGIAVFYSPDEAYRYWVKERELQRAIDEARR